MKNILVSVTLALMLLAGGCASFRPRPINPAETSSMLEARSLADTSLESFIEKNLHSTFSSWPPEKWNIDMLTLAALYFNPTLGVVKAQYQLAKAGVKTASQIPNPVLSLVPEYVTNPGGLSPWAPAVAIGEPILTAGKLGYQTEEAANLRQSAFYNLLATAWSIRSRIRKDIVHVYADGQRCVSLKEEEAAEDSIFEFTKQRFRDGEVSEQEVNAAGGAFYGAQVAYANAISQHEEDKVALAGAIGITEGKLDSVIFTSNTGPRIAFESFNQFPDTLVAFSRESMKEALTRRPDVLSALNEYKAAESNLQLQIAKQFPNFDIGPGFKWDQGQDKWSVGISFSLPIFNQNQGPIAEGEALRKEAEANFLAVQSAAITQIESARTRYRFAFQNLARADSLYATQQEFLAAEIQKESVGEVGLLDEAYAWLSFVEAGLEKVRAFELAQNALGQLEDALMTPLRRGEMNPANGNGVLTKSELMSEQGLK